MAQKKKKKFYRPRPSGPQALLMAWRMKGNATESEQLLIAEKAFEYLDGMKTHPDFFGFMKLVDVLNVLCVAIHNTTTPEECERNKCPNLHEWLTEVGHDDVAKKINDAHNLMFACGERSKRTKSYALDGDTYQAMEEVVQMYHQIYNVAPRGFMRDIIAHCTRIHKDKGNGRMTLVHLALNDYYQHKEKTWTFSDVEEAA